jgi:hypothetical protein
VVLDLLVGCLGVERRGWSALDAEWKERAPHLWRLDVGEGKSLARAQVVFASERGQRYPANFAGLSSRSQMNIRCDKRSAGWFGPNQSNLIPTLGELQIIGT